jgi:hypothetical protein
MLILPLNRRRRHAKKPSTQAAPPAALVLSAASADVDDDFGTVTLQFDRAIDVSAIIVTAIQVGTITTGNLYQGDGSPTFVDAQTVRIALVLYDSYQETNVMLFADADNGIVAVDDGGTWSGTGGTGLPFSS